MSRLIHSKMQVTGLGSAINTKKADKQAHNAWDRTRDLIFSSNLDDYANGQGRYSYFSHWCVIRFFDAFSVEYSFVCFVLFFSHKEDLAMWKDGILQVKNKFNHDLSLVELVESEVDDVWKDYFNGAWFIMTFQKNGNLVQLTDGSFEQRGMAYRRSYDGIVLSSNEKKRVKFSLDYERVKKERGELLSDLNYLCFDDSDDLSGWHSEESSDEEDENGNKNGKLRKLRYVDNTKKSSKLANKCKAKNRRRWKNDKELKKLPAWPEPPKYAKKFDFMAKDTIWLHAKWCYSGKKQWYVCILAVFFVIIAFLSCLCL